MQSGRERILMQLLNLKNCASEAHRVREQVPPAVNSLLSGPPCTGEGLAFRHAGGVRASIRAAAVRCAMRRFYVEREKEFALVGSIYKGRVTRVLPGMQSAFVEIGLDGDAFLYVSDFLEDIEDYDHGHSHDAPDAVHAI